MSYRDDLLALMAASWADLQEEIAKVRDQFDVEAKNGWRMQDRIAHIAVWERMAARKIGKVHLPKGEEFAAERPWSLSRFNKAMVDLWRPRSAAEVIAELNSAHAALVRAIEETDDCRLRPGQAPLEYDPRRRCGALLQPLSDKRQVKRSEEGGGGQPGRRQGLTV
jgi:hypothetical protein